MSEEMRKIGGGGGGRGVVVACTISSYNFEAVARSRALLKLGLLPCKRIYTKRDMHVSAIGCECEQMHSYCV